MNALISVNKKFMDVNPDTLVEIIKSYKYTKGIEICFDINSEEEVEYVRRIAYLCNANDLILQVHGDSSLSIAEQIRYLKVVEELYSIMHNQIVLTVHPLSDNTVIDGLNKTSSYLNEMIVRCEPDQIKLCLENLNDCDQIVDRLSKEDILPLLHSIDNLFMTYDIGHEIVENGDITDIDPFIIRRIGNVHIHSYNYSYSDGFDHKPIVKNDPHWNDVIKGIMYLKHIDYDKNVVFEYDLNACDGDTTVDKINSYLESIDLVAERL